MISSWSTCHKILHILMFITSFGEQNITYKCCSNFLIHLWIVISEVAAIFTYLADKYSEKGFSPALDDPKRGAYLKWMFFCHGPLTEYMDLKSLEVSKEQIEKRKTGLVVRFFQNGACNRLIRICWARKFQQQIYIWLIG